MKRNSFLSFLISRQLWVVIALIALCLTIWFAGPYMAIAGLRPLASMGMRMLLIFLLVTGALFALMGWSSSLVLLAFLCLLIWYVAPLLSFGQWSPFAPEAVRWGIIAFVVCAYAVYWLIRLWQRMRDDEQFLKRLLQWGRERPENPARHRLQYVEAVSRNAVEQLRAMRTGVQGWVRAFHSKRYLYELPWYVTLGANQSGKTSVLLKAGFSLPIAAQMQRAAVMEGAQGQPLDWWLTNEAVWIDTAGYYTCHGTSDIRDVANLAEGALLLQDQVPEPMLADGSAMDDRLGGEVTREKESAAAASLSAAGGMVARGNEAVDRGEWLGFLALLRKLRPRFPINGALLTVDLETLIHPDARVRMAHVAAMRARLDELRQELGIRFPVYLVITKMDQLTGFAEYFGTLTAEGRAQVWGFTLPFRRECVAFEHLRERCHDEMVLLKGRLADAINTRLQDEFETAKRFKLVKLPEEFAALTPAVVNWVGQLFLDSRYDDTQRQPMLRGVYFSSSGQGEREIVADRGSVLHRLIRSNGHPFTGKPRPAGAQSYFLNDFFAKVVLPESRLVRPNLRWEHRLRLVRCMAHALILMIALWLLHGITTSFGQNRDYLQSMADKTQALEERVIQQYKTQRPDAVPDTLKEVLALPAYAGLDLSRHARSWGFGLYAPPPIVAESRHIYDVLGDSLLLPHIVTRMEAVLLGAMAANDAKTAYDTLRVYLMLHDPSLFQADDVQSWVLRDWAESDGAAEFGGRASMVEHVQQLFSGRRVVQSARMRNELLVQRARSFLDASNAVERLYERAKTAMLKDAPDEFTLMRVLGPQAATLFTRASGQPITRGIPGLFTRDGYHNVFDTRLHEFVGMARSDDSQVMGRSFLGNEEIKTPNRRSSASDSRDSLTDAIRRQFLLEYRQYWEKFLGDIRVMNGSSLASNVQMLRIFAAPDSPLERLARAVSEETTLAFGSSATGGSFLQKAADQVNHKADRLLGIRASERVERELVDNHFAALREVATGNADAQAVAGNTSSSGAANSLGGVNRLLDELHLSLTLAENALSNNSMPPASDVAVKLKLTAETMPAPLREVLLQMAVDGSREVNQGIGLLLSRQMHAVIGDTCRLLVDGNYPFFPDSQRTANIDDFTRVFAQSGVMDEFFAKVLAPFVDTSSRPWRYRTLAGATESIQGPDLEPFERAKGIREVFFTDTEQKQLTWRVDLRVTEIDPSIVSLLLDVDGQTSVYQHGPVQPFSVVWPGPRGGAYAEVSADPRIRPDTSTVFAEGPWALMRLFQKGHVVDTGTPGRTQVAFELDGRRLVIEVSNPGTVANPLTSNVLSAFRCPSAIQVPGNLRNAWTVSETVVSDGVGG